MSEWRWAITPSRIELIHAIERLNCGFLVESRQGIILYVNRQVLEWSGYRVSDLEGQPIETLAPPELHSLLEQERARVHEGDQRTRLSAFRRADGRTFPVAIVPQVIESDDGEPLTLYLILDLGELQTARPIGAAQGSLAAELASVSLKLQSMTFMATVADGKVVPLDQSLLMALSDREREVLACLVAGSRVSAIADRLFISANTVRNHLKAMYRKLDVSSQSELIELVRGSGKGGS